jgi:hypothetical protein
MEDLTEEEREEVGRILDIVEPRIQREAAMMARYLASRRNREFFGESEFLMRDRSHSLGGLLIETALNERKKRGSKVP